MYKNTFDKYLKKRYPNKMTLEDICCTIYLSHHPVFNSNKPGKIRVVFNATSKHNSRSLNDTLRRGPDLLNNSISSNEVSSIANRHFC